jgi:tetratricopeptide (TPR) repeat protein
MELEDLLGRALSLADEEEWEAVVDLLQGHLEEFSEEPAVHCWLGVAERELGMEGVAYERFKQALALTPSDPYVLATAGNGIAAFDDADAETALRTAALTAPQIAVTRLLYGAYLSREGFTEESLKELNAAREIDPDDPQIAYELGVAHAIAGDYDSATDAMADAVRLDPEDGWGRVVFGLVLIEADRLDEGVGELATGARMREEDVDAQLAAALAMAATGRDGVAYEMLERARIRAADADLVLVTAVEDRLDGGHEASAAMLMEDFVPDLLRSRLSERP